MPHSGALVPFTESWLSSLLKSSGNHRSSTDRALGAAATLGLSIVILKLVAQAFKSVKLSGQESSAYKVVREIIKGLFQRNEEEEEETVESTETVIHAGSCHCRCVTFELVGPKVLIAKHGPGKINYAHTSTLARNFRFLQGTDRLQIYYVSVPAGSEHGVEPTIGAHTFCSQCGVHILHADSPSSQTLHVNVSCVDGGSKPRIKWNIQNNLSRGVPVATQWEDDNARETGHAPTWGKKETEDSTLDSFAKLDENLDDATPSDHSWKNPTDRMPGTPSTVGTIGTDSIVSAMRYRSLALEQDSASSEDSEYLSTSSKPVLPPLNTSLPRPGHVESPSRKTTTPMMRDQLKYYMSKHLAAKGKLSAERTNTEAKISRED